MRNRNRYRKSKILAGCLIGVCAGNLFYGYYEGSPPGKTGSVGDGGASCASTGCHNYGLIQVNGWITSDIPLQGYQPDSTYEIYLDANHNNVNVIGFCVTAEDSLGNKAGSVAVIDTVRTQQTGVYYLTHTEDGVQTTNDTNSWSFSWTAPPAGFGKVTFYAAFNTHDSLDGNKATNSFIQLSELTVNEASVMDIMAHKNNHLPVVEVYPNPAAEYIHVSISNGKEAGYYLQCVDIFGRPVTKQILIYQDYILNTSNFSRGTYLVLLKDETGDLLFTKKVAKE